MRRTESLSDWEILSFREELRTGVKKRKAKSTSSALSLHSFSMSLRQPYPSVGCFPAEPTSVSGCKDGISHQGDYANRESVRKLIWALVEGIRSEAQESIFIFRAG